MYRLRTSDKAWVPLLWLLAAMSRASNLHSYNICQVILLFALICQLGLCLHEALCVLRSLTVNWKPRRQTNKIYSSSTAAVWCMAMFTDFLKTDWSERSSGLLWFRSCGVWGGNLSPLLKLLLLTKMTVVSQFLTLLTLSNHHRHWWRNLWPNHIYS